MTNIYYVKLFSSDHTTCIGNGMAISVFHCFIHVVHIITYTIYFHMMTNMPGKTDNVSSLICPRAF